MTHPARPINDYAPTFDVTDTLVVTVDAEPEAVSAALEHLDLTASTATALSAFGGVDRVALAPVLLAAHPGPDLVFGLVWRFEGPAETVDPASIQTFDTPGHVKVIWDLSVQPGALEGAQLSMTRRFLATDEVTRARLLDSWGTIGVVANSLARRIVAAVKAYAEDWHQPPAPAATQSANERYELQTGSAASAWTVAPRLLRFAPEALFRGANPR